MALIYTAQPLQPAPYHDALLGGALMGTDLPELPAAWCHVPMQEIEAPLLSSSALSMYETWAADSPCQSGWCDNLFWRKSNKYTFGLIRLETNALGSHPPSAGECDYEDDLRESTYKAYENIFSFIQSGKTPYLWRIWNYIPRINAINNGLERYWQFNIGREKAFRLRHHQMLGNLMPPATTLGLARDSAASIAFLAGATAPEYIENPRQVSAFHYPALYGPSRPLFSRAALIYPENQEILFISGTASIVGHATEHPDCLIAQCEETVRNIKALLDEANKAARSSAFHVSELICRVYIRNANDAACVERTLKSSFNAAHLIFLQADICRKELLVEIEAFAPHNMPT